ncbi:unnamed protein product [Paramecium sonneborni]|uniref:Uncharacterized protein n=1 Tax=Paramecium sonneborni TaxID=65129 RepID=A0A8S1K7E4_9CILI|nr:unnamed protein product [Paramecium sonneborni]
MKQQKQRSQTPVLGALLFDFNIPKITLSGQQQIRNACVLKKFCTEKKRNPNNPIKQANPRKNLKYLFLNLDVNDLKIYDSDSDYQYQNKKSNENQCQLKIPIQKCPLVIQIQSRDLFVSI